MRVIKRKTTKTTTVKKTNNSTNTSSSNNSTNTNTSNNTSNTNYNDILNKLNNYALKSDLNGYLQNGALSNYVTNSDLLAALANIKQCNCENGTTLPTNTDNNVLNDLIRKLNNYGIFQYDVAGKETIVTEFFPHLTQNSTGSYSNGRQTLPIYDALEIFIALKQQDNPNLNLFDFIYIDTPNGRKTINECSLSRFFTICDEGKGYKISSAILNEQVTVETGASTKSIILYYPVVNEYSQWDGNLITAPIEFIPTSIFSKNGITCEFNGSYSGNGNSYITGGTITLTLPENVSLVNTEPNGTYNIVLNGNKITISLFDNNSYMYYVLYKQIIIADSSTKRYVIKINGEAAALPPNY